MCGVTRPRVRAEDGSCAERDEQQVEPVMDQSLPAKPCACSNGGEQVDRAAFEDAGADPRKNIVPAAPFDDDGVDPRLAEELPEQQSGRA